jgi:hypothetical protein
LLHGLGGNSPRTFTEKGACRKRMTGVAAATWVRADGVHVLDTL